MKVFANFQTKLSCLRSLWFLKMKNFKNTPNGQLRASFQKQKILFHTTLLTSICKSQIYCSVQKVYVHVNELRRDGRLFLFPPLHFRKFF